MTKKEVVRRILNAYLLGDDTFLHCCQTFIRMKVHEDVFAEFGLTTQDVLKLSEMKRSIIHGIDRNF